MARKRRSTTGSLAGADWECSVKFSPNWRPGPEARAPDDDATHQKPSHRSQSAQKGAVPRRIGRTKGGLNSKLHAVCDEQGRPLVMLLSEGRMSDYKGAALRIDALPKADAMLGDRGYDADCTNSSRSGALPAAPQDREICSVGSRTGDKSAPVMIDAPTRS